MNTTEPILRCVENVGDLPVLWATFQRVHLVETLDTHFPPPQLWKGPLSQGEVLAVWILFLCSQSDHCLNHVQPWVQQHLTTLCSLLGKTFPPTAFHDDRLADCLARLANTDSWNAFETHLTQHTLRVYQIPDAPIRLDTTTANSYAQILSEKGILQFGHSKDNPNLPQIKVTAAMLDPLGMPLVTTVVPGNTADDPVYIPLMQKTQQALGKGGKTYVGDCKMAALATRAFVVHSGDFYLCPLSETQLSTEERSKLLQSVWNQEVQLIQVTRPSGDDNNPEEEVAEGFCLDVVLNGTVEQEQDGKLGKTEEQKAAVTWTERRWLVRSLSYARSQEAALERRLEKTKAALEVLPARQKGKKRLGYEELEKAAHALCNTEELRTLLRYTIRSVVTKQAKRAYKDRPERVETEVKFTLEVVRNEEAINEQKREMGWQVYSTNNTALSLSQVVWTYRGQIRIEDGWARLKGATLGLTPMYLQEEDRIKGLVHLLSLALRMLTLLEWVVRERLKKDEKKLQNVYPGQPGRKTATPSAELLLKALKTISITVVEVAGKGYALLTPLQAIHQQLLELLDLPGNLYDQLLKAFLQPP